MGRKAGRAGGQSGARRGRDRSPGRSGPPSDELPSPSMQQLAPVRAACVFSTVARPSSSPPPPTQGVPSPPRTGLCCVQGFISSEAVAAACWCTAWVRKDLRRLEKVGRRWVCIVRACCQPQSPTGSRRHGADVREDKGRHSPHRPPLIDGLCPRGRRAGGRGDLL